MHRHNLALPIALLVICACGDGGPTPGANSFDGSAGMSGDASVGSSGSSSGGSPIGADSSSSGSGGGSGSSGSGSGGGSSGTDAGSANDAAVDGSTSTEGGPAAEGGSADASAQFVLTGDFITMGTRLCFKTGQTKNTGNTSPSLQWSGAPAGTMSFALSLKDLTNGITHWVMWNIPSTQMMLPPMLPMGTAPGAPAPAGSMQRSAPFAGGSTNPGYFGPGAAAPAHQYEFKLWALRVAMLTVTAAQDTTALYATVLPMNSIGSAMVVVYGDQDAKCQ